MAERAGEPGAVRPAMGEAVVVVGGDYVVEGSEQLLPGKGYWAKGHGSARVQQVWPEEVQVAS